MCFVINCLNVYSGSDRTVYFINSRGIHNSMAGPEEMSETECIKRCIANLDCLMIDYNIARDACTIAVSDKGLSKLEENVVEKYIARCKKRELLFR